MKPTEVSNSFVEAINSKRLDRLMELMTQDHVFIDSDGSEYHGREEICRGWESYFAMVPDYSIDVREVFTRDDTVVLLGMAEGTFEHKGSLDQENHWIVPAAWRVVVSSDQVAVWQLYVNPEPMQKILRRMNAM